jgi:hypothetical protein
MASLKQRQLFCRPEGATTFQPRATPWVNIAQKGTSPERAELFCVALSGLVTLFIPATQGVALG